MYVNFNVFEVATCVFCTICHCDLGIAQGGRDDIKKAKSAVEISQANICENLLKLWEKAFWPMQLCKNMWEPRNMLLPQLLTLNDPHDYA